MKRTLQLPSKNVAAMRQRVLDVYDCFVFDVDRTIAENGKPICDDITTTIVTLLMRVNIALVTSRGMKEHLDEFCKNIAARLKGLHSGEMVHKLFIFPVHAARAYQVDLKTGEGIELYNKGKDPLFLQFRKEFHSLFDSHTITINPDVHYDESEQKREVQIHDRQEQVTLFFSHMKLREFYTELLKQYKITITPHARNVLHITPFKADKKSAIEFLEKCELKKFLIFADGFYFDEKTGRQGNDLTFTLIPETKATCINVGERTPKVETGVWYIPESPIFESQLTNSLLLKIISGFTFDQLGLIQKKKTLLPKAFNSTSSEVLTEETSQKTLGFW